MRLCLWVLPLTFALSQFAGAASFDCDLADLTQGERMICDTRSLNDADVRMATTLHLLTGLFAMGTRSAMLDDQARWLRERMACGADAICIGEAYRSRQQQLDRVYESIDRPL